MLLLLNAGIPVSKDGRGENPSRHYAGGHMGSVGSTGLLNVASDEPPPLKATTESFPPNLGKVPLQLCVVESKEPMSVAVPLAVQVPAQRSATPAVL